MNESPDNEPLDAAEDEEFQARRQFLQGMGKWSGAAAAAAIVGAAMVTAPEAQAGRWVNRRLGGGRWVNGGGGGAWVNRRYGGGAWANRGYGGGAWVNRW